MKDYPEFKNGGYAKQGYYIVSSMTPRTDEGNGDCCWMNIDVHRLEQAALRDRQYVFDAYINGNRYIYSCPAKALNKIVPLFLTPLTRENGTQEWKLYVDYKLGEVYSDVHFTQEPFFYLNKIHTPEESLALFEQAKSTVMNEKDKTGCSSGEQNNQIIYENFQKGHKTKYIVTATSICSQNDERSWMNIPLKKLDSAVKASKKYVFDCFIDNQRFCFYNDARKLKDVFEESSVDIIDKGKPNERYSFYIDYRKGILYAKVSPNDTQKVIELKPFESQEQYKSIVMNAKDKTGCSSGEQNNQIIYENFQKGHKTKYIVTATSICSQNDERSWMNIPLKKLDSAVKASKKYVFDCFIDNQRFCFYNDARKLKDVFEESSVDIIDKGKPNERYSFYIDYRKGILYAKVSPNDKQKVIELKPFENQEQYNNIYEQTKF
ncbi:MAG: hypothetical protein Q4C05_03055 [Akkermansia sp.]|nr:hypothetical protein [Akkermansia sp.]